MHNTLAEKYFALLFENKIKVGKFLLVFGVKGKENSGPELAAKALLELIMKS